MHDFKKPLVVNKTPGSNNGYGISDRNWEMRYASGAWQDNISKDILYGNDVETNWDEIYDNEQARIKYQEGKNNNPDLTQQEK